MFYDVQHLMSEDLKAHQPNERVRARIDVNVIRTVIAMNESEISRLKTVNRMLRNEVDEGVRLASLDLSNPGLRYWQ
jgi:hypothetical protein